MSAKVRVSEGPILTGLDILKGKKVMVPEIESYFDGIVTRDCIRDQAITDRDGKTIREKNNL